MGTGSHPALAPVGSQGCSHLLAEQWVPAASQARSHWPQGRC